MIKLPVIIGRVAAIPLETYNVIIENYVNQVSKIDAVESILQIGSFSTPGLSDIDLIVVLNEDKELPEWDDISLVKLSRFIKGNEVIAHDVFVITKSIARKAEAYFYIDNQRVLYGERIGGDLDESDVIKCRSFLAMDYAIFNLVNLFNLLITKSIHVRKLALFISTMKHSLVLGEKLGFINNDDKIQRIEKIEEFRLSVINNLYDEQQIGYFLTSFVDLLALTIKEVGQKQLQISSLPASDIKLLTKGKSTNYLSVVNCADYSNIFQKWVQKHQKSRLLKYSKIVPIPLDAILHIQAYLGIDTKESSELIKILKIKALKDPIEVNNRIRNLRVSLAFNHWRFINNTGYKSSGVTFIGISSPFPLERSFIKRSIRSLVFNLFSKETRSEKNNI